MNNNNIVKIGSALKWRSTYDEKKRYYQENIVTMYGCVFRCKVLLAQDKPPVEVIDEAGRIGYINTDIWDVVVDMAEYYNLTIDVDERIEANKTAIKENAKNIEANRKEIEKHKQETSLNIDSINASIRTLQDELIELEDTHTQDIQEIRDYHSAHEKEHELIDNAIGSIGIEIDSINDRLDNCEKRLDAIDLYHSEQDRLHLELNKRLDNIDTSISTIETTLSDHKVLIDELSKKVAEGGWGGSTGFWNNDMLWMNELYWSNGGSGAGVNPGCCEEISKRLDAMQQSIDELTRVNNDQQTIIDKQQKQIEKLFSLIGSGISGTVKSYDPETRSITFGDHVSLDEYLAEIQTMKFGNMVQAIGYEEMKEQLTIM